jgi:hypothetical protein
MQFFLKEGFCLSLFKDNFYHFSKAGFFQKHSQKWMEVKVILSLHFVSTDVKFLSLGNNIYMHMAKFNSEIACILNKFAQFDIWD